MVSCGSWLAYAQIVVAHQECPHACQEDLRGSRVQVDLKRKRKCTCRETEDLGREQIPSWHIILILMNQTARVAVRVHLNCRCRRRSTCTGACMSRDDVQPVDFAQNLHQALLS
jgi:hypothetical protein